MEIINFISTHDAIFELALGFGFVFLVELILSKCRSAKNASPFVHFVLCTTFTYAFTIMKELVEFFIDFYSPNTSLQNFGYVPADDILLYRLFGQGSAQVEQYPVLDTDFDFIFMIIGCAVAGSVLLTVKTLKEKKNAGKISKDERETEAVCA